MKFNIEFRGTRNFSREKNGPIFGKENAWNWLSRKFESSSANDSKPRDQTKLTVSRDTPGYARSPGGLTPPLPRPKLSLSLTWSRPLSRSLRTLVLGVFKTSEVQRYEKKEEEEIGDEEKEKKEAKDSPLVAESMGYLLSELFSFPQGSKPCITRLYPTAIHHGLWLWLGGPYLSSSTYFFFLFPLFILFSMFPRVLIIPSLIFPHNFHCFFPTKVPSNRLVTQTS